MRSVIQSIISDFERANAALVSPTEAFLACVCGDTALHTRFMNTLSMMEHIGSHKIMATQRGGAISMETLKHLSEEARHAFFFKREAEKSAGRALAFANAELLAPAHARMYFQRLEAAIMRPLHNAGDPEAGYLYTSMIVEFRAVWAYRLYQAALKRAGLKLSLKSLLAEEQGHLADMAGRLDANGSFDLDRVADYCAEETRLYERLLNALTSDAGLPLAA